MKTRMIRVRECKDDKCPYYQYECGTEYRDGRYICKKNGRLISLVNFEEDCPLETLRPDYMGQIA